MATSTILNPLIIREDQVDKLAEILNGPPTIFLGTSKIKMMSRQEIDDLCAAFQAKLDAEQQQKN